MRRPEIRILTRSPRRFAARCRIFLGLGIDVLEYGSETVTHRRATGQGSIFLTRIYPATDSAGWLSFRGGPLFLPSRPLCLSVLSMSVLRTLRVKSFLLSPLPRAELTCRI